MEVVVHADREGDSARLILAGPFDLPHAVTTAQADREHRERRSPAAALSNLISRVWTTSTEQVPSNSPGSSIAWRQRVPPRRSWTNTTRKPRD